MPTLYEIREHSTVTRGRGLRYLFTPKHHGAVLDAAQWLPSLSFEEEFAVFDDADVHELRDDDGNLYGVRREAEGSLSYIGTRKEQVAEFPVARDGEAWHGYPVYPLTEMGQRHRPDRSVFNRMVEAGLINRSQRRRLLKGNHA
jgi:hypothetical protein